MNSVKVPYSYFVKSAQNDYQYPREAFFREFLQNSVDAGSKNIELKIYEKDGKTYFECVDDGCGMTEDIIRNKLLTLGETSKEGTGATGGFGVAKILIYFSHPSYEIYTQDNIVKGSGGCYTIEKNSEYVKGTRSIVEINTSVFRTSYLEDYVITEISRSFLPNVNITLNGNLIPADHKRGRQIAEIDDSITIHKKNLSDTTSEYVLVRVNGLHMFKIYCGEHKFQLVVELKNYSTKILTTNRDGLRYEWSDKVSKAIQEICQDPSKEKTKSKTNYYKGKSTRISPVKIEETISQINHQVNEKLQNGIDQQTILEDIKCNVQQTYAEAGFSAAEQTLHIESILNVVKRKIEDFLTTGTKLNLTMYDLQDYLAYNVYIQTVGNYRKVPATWEPANFNEKQKNLIALWGKIVGMVLRDTGNEGVQYDVGYIFDDGTQGDVVLARYSEIIVSGKHTKVFYLNPTKYGDQNFFPYAANKQIEVTMWLMELAVHEITHCIGFTGHNHEFVGAEANLKLKVLKNIKEYISL